jgi:predicted nucleotidyltransferase
MNNIDVVNDVCKTIINKCGSNIVSVYNYGSALTNNFSSKSDFDFLVIVNDAEPDLLLSLRGIVQQYQLNGIKVDINVQQFDEMPNSRLEAFWHNNRGLFIQAEISNYGKLLYGDEQFLTKFSDMNPKMIRLESVRVLNSLVYQARKCIINKQLTNDDKYVIFKHCIYASMYAIAAKNIFLNDYGKILKEFCRQFPELDDPRMLAKIKKSDLSKIKESDVFRAYDFIKSVDRKVYNIYKEKND